MPSPKRHKTAQPTPFLTKATPFSTKHPTTSKQAKLAKSASHRPITSNSVHQKNGDRREQNLSERPRNQPRDPPSVVLHAKVSAFDTNELGEIWKRPAQLAGFKVESLPHEFVLKMLDDLLVLSSEYQTLLSDSLTTADAARILAASEKGLLSDAWPCHKRALDMIEDQKTRNWMPAAIATAKQNVENLEGEKDDLVRKNQERQEDSEKIAAALSAAEKEIAGLKQCKREWLAEKVALEEKASTVDTLEKDKREWQNREDELKERASIADMLEAEELG